MEIFKLVCDSWSKRMLQDLSIMQKCGLMCDVKICLSDDVIFTHSCVLSAASPFLRSILEGTEAPELDFRDFPSKIIQEVIQFIYTGQIVIAKAEIYILYSVATHLHIPALISMLQTMVVADEKEAEQFSPTENDPKKYTSLEIKKAQEVTETAAFEKPDDDDELSKDDIVEISIKKAASGDEMTEDQMDEEDDNVSEEGFTSFVAVEVKNGGEVNMLDNILHSKGLHTEQPEENSTTSRISHSTEDRLVEVDQQLSQPVEYHCDKCNIAYVSSLHYYKHMHHKHGKALPIDIYIMVEKERKSRLGQNASSENDNEKPKKTKPPLRKKKCFRNQDNKNDNRFPSPANNQKEFARKNNIICGDCKRGFKSITSLKLHEIIHRDERPFKCKRCNQAFSQAGNLKVHERSHTGEKPFQCSQCGRSFGQSGHLKAHMRTHTGEKPFMCSVCGARFSSNSNLESHVRCHTGEKPYKCITCGKAFSQLGNLNAHQRSHTGIKPYRCSQCSKAFTALCNYQRHMKRHLVHRPFRCPDCGKGFVNNSEMRSHQRNKHMIIFDPDYHKKLGIHYPTKNRQNVVKLT